MLPVAHEPLGEAKVEGVQQLPKSLLGYGVGCGRAGEDVLGLQAVLVGQEFQGLHLFRADAATPLGYVQHRLIARLEHQLPPHEARVVLEVGFPDAERERVNEVPLGACRFEVGCAIRPFGTKLRLQGLRDESGERVGVPVPPSTLEPGPVAVVSDAAAVDLHVNDQGVPVRDGDGLGVQGVVVAQESPILEKLDSLERAGEGPGVGREVDEVLYRRQGLFGVLGDATFLTQHGQRRAFDVLVEGAVKGQVEVGRIDAERAPPCRDQVGQLQDDVLGQAVSLSDQ